MVAEEERFARGTRGWAVVAECRASGLSDRALVALAEVHSELRQLRELEADDAALRDSFAHVLTGPVRAVLANECMERESRVFAALAALDAAVGEGKA